MRYRLYVTVNNINGKVYGGKHYWRKDTKYMGSGYTLQNAFKLHGKDNFSIRWFKLDINTPEDLNRLEIKLIRRLHRMFGKNNCYNIHKGGTGGGYTEYMTEEEIKKVNKKVSEGLKRMYKDPEKYAKWKSSLKNRKDTSNKRIEKFGKSVKELKRVQFKKDNGLYNMRYKIIYPNGDEVVESNCLKSFIIKYNTDDFIFLRLRKYGVYTFNHVTKLSKHPFPRKTIIQFISEKRTHDNYNKEEPVESSVSTGSIDLS